MIPGALIARIWEILFAIGVAVGFLFLIVPGLILLVTWAVTSAVAPVSALSASVLYFSLRG